NRDRDTGQLILDEDDRQHALGRIEGEAQRLDIRQRVHVEVERRLRYADLDLGPEVGDVRARHRTGLDVEDVAHVLGQLANVLKVRALLRRYLVDRNLHVGEQQGDRQRNHAEQGV